MGNETILYYVTEESVTGCKRTQNPYFWQKIKLPSYVMEEDGITVVMIMVPALKKGWKREKLLRQMKEVILQYPAYAADAQMILHPEIQRILTAQEDVAPIPPESDAASREAAMTKTDTASGQAAMTKPDTASRQAAMPESGAASGQAAMPESDTASGQAVLPKSGKVPVLPVHCVSRTEWRLAEKILRNMLAAKRPHIFSESFPESVVLLLGESLFPEEQMQKFMEQMQPYFPRINHLFIAYLADGGSMDSMDVEEKEDMEEQEKKEDGAAGADVDGRRWEEVICGYTQDIYYEYGLVAQVQNGSGHPFQKHSVRTGQSRALFLDYGYPETRPLRALRAGDFYLDIFSSEAKEALFRRKYMEISYASPRKYLDTLVKSGYDKLVHQV